MKTLIKITLGLCLLLLLTCCSSNDLESICYNYRPDSIYYQTYPYKLISSVSKATVITKTTKIIPVYIDPFSLKYVNEYILTLEVESTGETIEKKVTFLLYKDAEIGGKLDVEVIFTNCYGSERKIVGVTTRNTVVYKLN